MEVTWVTYAPMRGDLSIRYWIRVSLKPNENPYQKLSISLSTFANFAPTAKRAAITALIENAKNLAVIERDAQVVRYKVL